MKTVYINFLLAGASLFLGCTLSCAGHPIQAGHVLSAALAFAVSGGITWIRMK